MYSYYEVLKSGGLSSNKSNKDSEKQEESLENNISEHALFKRNRLLENKVKELLSENARLVKENSNLLTKFEKIEKA